MTQKSGRVLCFPNSLRIYLRSSPIICAADTLDVITQIVVALCQRTGRSQAAQVIVVWKFADNNEKEKAALQKLKDNLLLRFLLFVFGVLLPTVKVFGMRGVPWTQAWAGMYFASYVVTEALLLLQGWYGSVPAQSPGSGQLPQTTGLVIGFLASFGQVALSFWECFRLIKYSHSRYPSVKTLVLVISFFMWFLLFIRLRLMVMAHKLRRWTTLCGLTFLIDGFAIFGSGMLPFPSVYFMAVTWFLVPFILLTAVAEFLAGFTTIRKTLLLLEKASEDEGFQVLVRLHAAVTAFFFFTIGLSILWFRFCYDPTRTLKPGWTNKLG
ncbi:uncharacterized protein K452DRAFT_345438 [Aplosporella prunicola CBS 121167]|uniref:Uncharacterized protein n=1 Tax=Aplosporella prunicola CBS 121167 TaxID=1176127 RepID=A0A6A6BKV4_9PEZI|nr:uncharacterized protein K452DRAFT_345438 [Aplosporella prunicola CBS 121167]KAF2144013.1 hypothetical protein K452DRAFT_345438 [Aplosporella prunicola CBS 121167]